MSIWKQSLLHRTGRAAVAGLFFFSSTVPEASAEQFKKRRSPSLRDRRPSPRLIILPDRHCHYSAQIKIRDALVRLRADGWVQTVFLEGNSGLIDADLFAALPNLPIRKNIVDRMMRKGLITGAEGGAIENPDFPPLVGIEDPVLYAASLHLLQKAFRDQAAIRVKTTRLNEWRERIETSRMAPELRDFIHRDVSLAELKGWADKTGVSLARFPTLLAGLGAVAPGPRAPPARLDLFSLFDDVLSAKESIENVLAKTNREKKVVRAVRYVHLLTRLCLAEITPSEMEHYRRIRGDGPSIDDTLQPRDPRLTTLLRDLESERKSQEKFYALAQKREIAMAGQMNVLMAETQNAVCIAGGYHSTSLKRLAEANGIQTVLFIPDISGPSGRDVYAGLLASQTLALPSFLPTAPFRKYFFKLAVREVWNAEENAPLSVAEKIKKISSFLREWKRAFEKKSAEKFPFSLAKARWRRQRAELALTHNGRPFLLRLGNRKPRINKTFLKKGPRRLRVLLVVQGLLGISFHASFFMVHLMNEGYSLSLLARHFAIFSPAYLAGSVLWMMMVGRWGKHRILIASLLLNATGTVCLAFAGLSPAILAVSQALGALSLAGYSVTLHNLLYEGLQDLGQPSLFQSVYGRAMQRFWIGMAFSSLLGGWVASWVPLWAVILASSLVPLGLAGLMWTVFPKEKRHPAVLPSMKIHFSIKNSGILVAAAGRQILSHRGLRRLVILSLFINGFFLLGVDFLTQPLLKEASFPLALFGFLTVALHLTHAFSARYAHRLDRWVLCPVRRTAYFLMMLILLLGVVAGNNLFCLAVFLLGVNFWQGLLFIVGPAQVHEKLSDEHRSPWCSLWNLLNAGTSMIGFIFLSELLSWMAAPWTLTVLLLGAIIASAVLR